MTKNLYIGIDPDIDKSGIAIWENDNKILVLKNLSFFQIFDLLNENKDRIAIVRIECGWLNHKSNWHNRREQTKTAGERISKNVGENHAVAKLLCQMCVFHQILHEEIRPTAHKLDKKLFKQITGYSGRTNQETRDAGMLLIDLIVNKE
jgi:hypothetical protein